MILVKTRITNNFGHDIKIRKSKYTGVLRPLDNTKSPNLTQPRSKRPSMKLSISLVLDILDDSSLEIRNLS